jgi:iron complex transport system permease protein
MSEKISAKYKKLAGRRLVIMLLIFLLSILVGLFSMILGSAEIDLNQLLNFFSGNADKFTSQIILQIRLPRIIAAFISGLALAISGTVVQSILRNPLASPFTLGISSAAAFGAAFAIVVLGAGISYSGSDDLAVVTNPYILTISAFAWSLVSVVIIVLLSRFKGARPEIIILSGIIISSLFGAGISAIQYFADEIQLASIVFWTFGDLGRASWQNILILAVIMTFVIFYFIKNSWNYKALQSGDEYATSLGINVLRTRLIAMLVAALATAVVVSFYGIIAFVGLVVPHIVRRVIGGDEIFLIPASALFGGLFLLLSDTFARLIISPVVLPVGILTSFLGAPLFLFLLIRGIGKNHWD